ncbi:unnamed protein product [Rhizoctonia solani]|uniref:RlpA-like protein double-psi beta-barrel domain-containing protein n=1 Tax=Rhizoctonia solani TaxID=456999 RepID=A0A8H3B2X1_9AGAM|nr:unnamed protein product [Rhizoctonia solani]
MYLTNPRGDDRKSKYSNVNGCIIIAIVKLVLLPEPLVTISSHFLSFNLSLSSPLFIFQSSAMKGFLTVVAIATLSSIGGASASSNYREKRITHTGQLTWYDPISGNDGCGYKVPNGAPGVHVSPTYWRGGQNCGQWVQLNVNGKQSYGIVTGECKTCPPEGIDIKPWHFTEFAHTDVGLLLCSWKFMNKNWEPKDLPECEE